MDIDKIVNDLYVIECDGFFNDYGDHILPVAGYIIANNLDIKTFASDIAKGFIGKPNVKKYVFIHNPKLHSKNAYSPTAISFVPDQKITAVDCKLTSKNVYRAIFTELQTGTDIITQFAMTWYIIQDSSLATNPLYAKYWIVD